MEKFEGHVLTNNIKIYCKYLPGSNPIPIVLIMGLAFQMTTWPQNLIELLQKNGYSVLLFDNRDIGLSQKINQSPPDNLLLNFLLSKLGLKIIAPYTLYDMSKDVVGLLDHFEISRAHILGMSMGGMISQIIASNDSERVASLTLLSTTDNSNHSHLPTLEMSWRLLGSGISGHDLESVKKRGLLLYRSLQSKAYPKKSDRELNEIFERNYKRAYSAEGRLRQIYAILSSPSLGTLHKNITAPTCIIHGDSDPLIHKSSAYRLHKSIRNSKLHIVPGYGHDLPPEFMPLLTRYLFENIQSFKKEENSIL